MVHHAFSGGKVTKIAIITQAIYSNPRPGIFVINIEFQLSDYGIEVSIRTD